MLLWGMTNQRWGGTQFCQYRSDIFVDKISTIVSGHIKYVNC